MIKKKNARYRELVIMKLVIREYLKLPNPELYTGHCFRRSSATILIDAGKDITSLKRHGGWKSTTVAVSYIDGSMKNEYDIANEIVSSINESENLPSTPISYNFENEEISNVPLQCPNASQITFDHCDNITVNTANE
ncbi:hypothetical protein JTB14_031016 [Gonioctena quinquepunctata]|nr:hypothetical protein JTB14_031016 [Gonioctena quinquepunctata]